ncbi:IS3 family transposase [Profundibacterium mesophilum KAUST100406-0324]|uniref:IS3 family transposase n=1 Tax=Profundibacterium mesophilum KAUST100406-0324 TaxID=1037889 RepID=A0A921TBK5_9RHOB|nr:IS3 family transposase [Profundibacterium mesophilum KAUST100406-0324]
MDWAMTEKSYSQRRACALVGIDPYLYRRQSTRPSDEDLRRRLRELAGERRRFGYRRLHLLLEREGWVSNRKKLYRLYREEGLTVRKRGGRERAIGTRAPMAIPQGPNQRWSLDFVSDSFADGRRFRVLCVIIRHCRSDRWRDMAHLQPGMPGGRRRYLAVRPVGGA